MNSSELKAFLDFKADQFESPEFIEFDPICIPHKYHQKEDIEIMGILIATIAWGNRKSIIKSGNELIKIVGSSPYDYVMTQDHTTPVPFVHRTFNAEDLAFFFQGLKKIYSDEGLEKVFYKQDIKSGIINFRKKMLEIPHYTRSEKHLSNPDANSACKRLNMFLRWMVRSKVKGVDFGLWTSISPSNLIIPLDVHTGNIARKLNILVRKQNDGTAAKELMSILRNFDPIDPVKYDFALFGLGAMEEF
ncbi:MAG: TIGR02757 family protein [Flavobacteriales bacterium]